MQFNLTPPNSAEIQGQESVLKSTLGSLTQQQMPLTDTQEPEMSANGDCLPKAEVPSQVDPLPPMDGQPVPYDVFVATVTDFEVRIAQLEKAIFGA